MGLLPLVGPGVAKTILVVEDDSSLRATMVEILEQEGFRVLQAADGSAAFAHLANPRPPSLIILDLKVPIMDVMEFVSMVQESIWHSAAVPVLILADAHEAPTHATALGMLLKPFDSTRLLERVRHLIR